MIATATSPFVHVFCQAGRWYAYDLNTNGLLEVDEALGRTLGALTSERPRQAVGCLRADLGREIVRRALAEIEEAQRTEGLFLTDRPGIVPRQLTDDDLAQYESGLSHLILIVTEDCNLACRYCPQAANRPGNPAHMPLTTALAALTGFSARCREVESPAVSFYGGEPLLRRDLIAEVVRFARSQRDWPAIRFTVDTNGTLLDDAAVELIARERLHLQVSLDGPPVAHDRWRVGREGRGTHAAVLAGLERLLRRDPSAAQRISLQVTMAPPIDLEATAEWFDAFEPYRALGIEREPALQVGLADLTWAGGGAESPADPEQVGSSRRKWLAACADGRRAELSPLVRGLFDPDVIRFYHRGRHSLGAGITPGGCCLPGVRRLAVRPDGGLEACERARSQLRLGQVPGWIVEQRVLELQADFERALQGRCGNCWAMRVCGVCYAMLERDPAGGRPTLSPERCEESRARAATMMANYAALLSRNGQSAATFLANSRVA